MDESFFVAESYEKLLVFGEGLAWPGDAVAPNTETGYEALERLAKAHSAEGIAARAREKSLRCMRA